MRNTTIRVQAAGEVWAVLGQDIAPGVVPEDVVLTANQAGPDSATFTLKRDARIPWGDLRPFTPVDIEVEGAGLVWSGRLHQATPNEAGWQIACRGWQHHLDDDVLERTWVRAGVGGWIDARTVPGMNLAVFDPRSDFQATAGTSLLAAIPAGSLPGSTGVGWWLDAGENMASISADYQNLGTGNADVAFVLQGYDNATYTAGGVNAYNTATNAMAASGTVSGNLGAGKRYLFVGLSLTGAPSLAAALRVQVTGIRIFRSTSYRSGGDSVLRASTVISDVLASGALPLLSSSTSRISTSGLIDAGVRGIPHLTTEGGYETPRQIMLRANSYHDWLMGVDAQRRVFFQARPTTPIAVLGGWSGDQYQDAGDTGDELYNKVIVQATGADGQPVQVTRTATSPLLSLAGATRTKILTAQAALTVAAAEVIGDAWLARRATRPARGGLTATGPGSLRLLDGTDVVPVECLAWPGQLIRLADRWDPDTGGIGRDAAVTDVSWSQATDQASITLDSPNERLDVVLSRYASIEASRPAGY